MATFILNNLYDFLKQNYINYDLELYCLETNEVGLKLYRNLQFKEGKDLYSNRTKSIKFIKIIWNIMEKLLILIIMLFISAESLNKLDEIFDKKYFNF